MTLVTYCHLVSQPCSSVPTYRHMLHVLISLALCTYTLKHALLHFCFPYLLLSLKVPKSVGRNDDEFQKYRSRSLYAAIEEVKLAQLFEVRSVSDRMSHCTNFPHIRKCKGGSACRQPVVKFSRDLLHEPVWEECCVPRPFPLLDYAMRDGFNLQIEILFIP